MANIKDCHSNMQIHCASQRPLTTGIRYVTGLTIASLTILTLGAARPLPAPAQTPSTIAPADSPTRTEPVQIEPDAVLPPSTVAPVMPDTTPLAAEAESSYTLGAGDQIRIDIFNVPEFSGNNGTYSVLVDGTLNLPWIGAVSVRGLTLTQSANLLTSRYARYINNPLLTVTLLNPRPLRIGVSGEVNRPGSYIVTPEGEGGAAPSQTVTQAIQTAGGITQIADVRRVQVRRPQLSGEEIINVDLWALLQAGDLSQDVRLRDGDTVIVPTATTITASEAPQLAVASFSPDTINVNVVGEVVSPGVVTVPPNTSLNQAILAAGGFDNRRARRGEVELIRLNPDGTAVRETLPVDFSAGLSAETNPALRNNDIVVVSRSGVTRTTDFLQTILAPLNPLTSIFGILRLFGIN